MPEKPADMRQKYQPEQSDRHQSALWSRSDRSISDLLCGRAQRPVWPFARHTKEKALLRYAQSTHVLGNSTSHLEHRNLGRAGDFAESRVGIDLTLVLAVL